MSPSGCRTGERNNSRDYGNMAPEEKIVMKMFRPDRDQVSMFRFKGIHNCQVCFDACDGSRLVAQPGCCKFLMHLSCFNDVAARLNSATTFFCPKCDRELSGESVRSARRRTSPTGGMETGEDTEMLLGSMAIKDITARKNNSRTVSGGKGDQIALRQTVQPSGKASESGESCKNSNIAPEACDEEVSDHPRRLSRDSQTLTFFPPYSQMKRIVAAEQKGNNRSESFSCKLLVMVVGRRKSEELKAKENLGRKTEKVYSKVVSVLHGQLVEQLVPDSSRTVREQLRIPALGRGGERGVFVCDG